MIRADVLLVDPDPNPNLVQGLRRLPGLRVVRAASMDAMQRLLADPAYGFRVAMLSADASEGLTEAVSEVLTPRFEAGSLTGIAFGARPGPDAIEQLAGHGFRLGLWRPFDEHVLRFQMNRALLRGRRMGAARGALRTAPACAARVLGAGAPRDARVYSLSRHGAYLATGRPSPPGAQVEVTLLLDDQPVSLGARVVHANVPGNLQRGNVPLGMGVRFTTPAPAVLDRLDRLIHSRLRTLGR